MFIGITELQFIYYDFFCFRLGEACSHIAAVLFKIELGVRFGLTQKSVTSEACKWNKVFRKQVCL
jgi:hypothetical protein